MKNWIFALLLIVLGLSACDNTLDINAPWRETPVVFAVIDLGQDSQILRIQKTYQNDANQSSNQAAQIADSLYLKNITVRISLDADTSKYKNFVRLAPRKEAGFFSNQDSSYWGALATNWFTSGSRYQLKIHSNETGKDYIGTTDVVGKATIPQVTTIDLSNLNTPTFSFQINNVGSANSTMLDLYIRLSYNEVSVTNPQDSVVKYFDYYIRKSTTYASYSSSNYRYSAGVKKVDYLNALKRELTVNPNVRRTFNSLAFEVMAYNRDYIDMQLTNAPSGSVIPKFGEYSNINNAIGVFASRTRTSMLQLTNSANNDYLNVSVLNPTQ